MGVEDTGPKRVNVCVRVVGPVPAQWHVHAEDRSAYEGNSCQSQHVKRVLENILRPNGPT